MEIYKDIRGYEGLYQVSDTGKVYSIKRNKELSIQKSKGYLRVQLWKNGSCKWFLIHRLVAEAFIPNPDNLPQVNHKDECKFNNNIDNLEWCSAKYNSNYGTRITRMEKEVLQYDLNGNFIKKWPSIKSTSDFGFIPQRVGQVCLGRSFHHKNYIWKYA